MFKKANTPSKKNNLSSVLLLLSCLVFIFLFPVLEFNTSIFTIILFSVIMLLAAYSINTKVMLIGIGAILIEVATGATNFIYLHYFAEIITNVFIVLIVIIVIKHLMIRKKVDIYALVDAINGYLLLSIVFMSLVSFCDQYLPEAYNNEGKSGMELVYYTMITITTSGYGDITPQLPLTQSLSMLIAVTGQFYVAVIVAILVGKYSSLNSRIKGN